MDKLIGKIKNGQSSDIEVRVTDEYDKFKLYDENREKNLGHIKKLVQSMEEELLFTIIFVDALLRIIDGQHRFNAIKELGEKIIYAILPDYGLKQVIRYNTNLRNWNDDDYLKFYCSQENPEYLIYKRFREQFADLKLSHSVTQGLLIGNNAFRGSANTTTISGIPVKKKAFWNGTFKVKDHAGALRVANFLRSINFKHRASGPFVQAISNILKSGVKYDTKRLQTIINRNARKMSANVRSRDEYITILTQEYNSGLSSEKRVSFYDPRFIKVSA